MTAVRVMAAGLLMLGLVAGVRAEEKKADGNKEKLVGTWEVVKSDEGGAPPVGTMVMFAKDGKMKLIHKKDDKEMTTEGTNTADGDKNTTTMNPDDKQPS